jgi:hypothetical protein
MVDLFVVLFVCQKNILVAIILGWGDEIGGEKQGVSI